ncbi:PREDICTED: uncharacterized protein LOC105560030 [Vollenhovia emeryi]|uniref:uncharacterized protein LOC105560030 n=1 Tax=Vollenhovia emeryi TaxID=411798 RepID=UPI0005F4918A|nr:PREDICTED: uncharacterized protein LOC105560030 [Vollenhovia emeryi]
MRSRRDVNAQVSVKIGEREGCAGACCADAVGHVCTLASIPVVAEINVRLARPARGAETLTVRQLEGSPLRREEGSTGSRPSGSPFSGERKREEREKETRQTEGRARPSRSSGTGQANDAEAMLLTHRGISRGRKTPVSKVPLRSPDIKRYSRWILKRRRFRIPRSPAQ